MSKKKKTVTAPLSYDPGKGRPKEYLAYLNWQEMQALQRLNGGNMERGPMGLPSFPPDWKGPSGGGTSSGNWQGAPSTAAGSTSGGGSDSGSRGSVTSSAPNAAAAAAASKLQASDSAAQQAAETKNAATAAKNSALTQDAKKGGIASINVGPMQAPVRIGGGAISQAVASAATQPSVPTVSPPVPSARPSNLRSPDIKAQIAEGIMGVAGRLGIDPVDLGTAISYETAGTFNPTKKGQPTKWGTHRGLIQFGEPQAQQYGVDWKNPVESQLGPGGAVESYLKDAGVKPGMGMMDVYSAINAGQVGLYNRSDAAAGGAPGTVADKVRDQMAGHRLKAESLLGDYIATAAPPSFGSSVAVPDAAAGAVIGALRNVPSAIEGIRIPAIPEQNALVKMMPDAAKIAYANKMAGDFAKKIPGALTAGLGALDRMVNRPVPASEVVAETPKITQDRLFSTPAGITTEVSPEEVDTLDPANRAGFEAAQRMQQYSPRIGSVKQPTPEEQKKLDMQNQWQGLDIEPQNYDTDQATLDRLASVYEGAGIGVVPPSEGVTASVIKGKYNYPVKPDGTPYTAEDLQNLPPSILSDYMDKVRFARMTDEPYPMTPEQREKAFVAKGLGRVISANPLTRAFVAGTNLIGKGIRALPGEMGDEFGGGLADAGGALRDPGAAVEAYETANPLRKIQMEVLAGGENYIPGTRPSGAGTSYAGGAPTQELGGKSDPYSVSRDRTVYAGAPATASTMETGRPSQYYLWDLGVGVPSPGDPEYNDYQEYLKDRRTTA
jgi:hypothetical protein